MLDENYGFCPHCGENLKSDAVYCPACGTVLKSEAAQNNAAYYSYAGACYGGKSPMAGRFMIAFLMLVVYAIFNLVGSASMFMMNESTYDMMDQIFIDTYGKTFSEYMLDFGLEITKEQFLSDAMVMGVSGVISSILAGIAAFFCYKREKFKYAVGFCILSAVVGFVGSALAPVLAGAASGMFGLLIGLLVAYLIYSSRHNFAS